MVTETILNPVKKWEIIIPLAWRKMIWIDNKPIRARIDNNRIILEPINDIEDLDIKEISLEDLNKETRDAIKKADENYKAWRMDKFISHNEFWNV